MSQTGDLVWVSNYHPEQSMEMHKYAPEYIKGPPKETKSFTADQLRQMGYIGLYKRQDQAAG